MPDSDYASHAERSAERERREGRTEGSCGDLPKVTGCRRCSKRFDFSGALPAMRTGAWFTFRG